MFKINDNLQFMQFEIQQPKIGCKQATKMRVHGFPVIFEYNTKIYWNTVGMTEKNEEEKARTKWCVIEQLIRQQWQRHMSVFLVASLLFACISNSVRMCPRLFVWFVRLLLICIRSNDMYNCLLLLFFWCCVVVTPMVGGQLLCLFVIHARTSKFTFEHNIFCL